jgi:hypothetical protein
LKAAIALNPRAVGNGIVDRREFDEVVFTLARTSEQEQYKPDWLQRLPSHFADHLASSVICHQSSCPAIGLSFRCRIVALPQQSRLPSPPNHSELD